MYKAMILFLVVSGLANLVSAQSAPQPNIGRCRSDIRADSSITLERIQQENNGIEKFVFVTDVSFFRGFQWVYTVRSRTSVPGVYSYVIYGKKFNQPPQILNNGLYYDAGNGITYAIDNTGGQYVVYKITWTKYVVGRYASYYICHTNGADRTADYRNVILLRPGGSLTQQEKNNIFNNDRAMNYLGNIKELP